MRGIEPDPPEDQEDREVQADAAHNEEPGGHDPQGHDPEAEEAEEPEEPEDEIASRRFDTWRRRSAVGGMATGIALGLQEVFYPNKNEPVISAEAPGEPPDADDRLRVILDPDDPTKSIVLLPKPASPPTDT
jgi:hypothetical protein